MSNDRNQEENRRKFLAWLSASPLLAMPNLQGAQAQSFAKRPDPMVWPATIPEDQLIKNPAEAVNVFDFEPVAYKNVPPAHFGYMASGIDDEVTLRANRSAFLHYQLRPRRLRDVSTVSTAVKLFGSNWNSPIIIAPTGGNRSYHPDGELAVARAAKAGGYLNVLSSAAGTAIEDVVAARGGEVWYQLYATSSLEVAKAVVRRVEKAGVPVLEITVDRNGGRNQETFFRMRKLDSRTCVTCHTHGIGASQDRPNYAGIDMTQAKSMQSSNMTWDFIKQMRDTTKMKIVLKGIVTEEDAKLALQYGVDGVYVSNHGGRSEDGSRASIDCLSEVAAVARGKIPVLFDSGVRRGSDIFKALALGADAVCVGRPYLWGLGAFGQPGVERVMQLLQTELRGTMQQMGVHNIASITPEMVTRV
jgi:isopentenyl diphosphate isomerase/L-lactate dehydrogenase-like FMN-dependent dehydrogenase